MAELNLETGTRYAAEFHKMLASDIPLIDAVRWWDRVASGEVLPNLGNKDLVISSAEAAAVDIVGYAADWDTYVIDPVRAGDPCSRDRTMHEGWVKLEGIRAKLRQASA